MRFDVSIAHEADCTRIAVTGEPSLGRLLSLLHVLQVDSASWPCEAVVLDLRGLDKPLTQQEQSQFSTAAGHALPRMKHIAVLAHEGGPAAAAPVRAFADADAALRWLVGNP